MKLCFEATTLFGYSREVFRERWMFVPGTRRSRGSSSENDIILGIFSKVMQQEEENKEKTARNNRNQFGFSSEISQLRWDHTGTSKQPVLLTTFMGRQNKPIPDPTVRQRAKTQSGTEHTPSQWILITPHPDMSLFIHLLLVAAGNPPITSDCRNSSCN